jgi:serine protease AprX
MKNIYILGLLFTISLMSSQNKDEVSVILDKSDLNGLKANLNRFMFENKNKEVLINQFLLNNPKYKRQYYKNSNLFEIVDVINGKPIYITTDNALAAQATKTSTLHSGGSLGLNIEGQNMIIGVWDGGFALKSHVEFMNDDVVPTSRVSTPQTPNPNPATSDHGTHVMGTLIAKGINANAKGMAPKANAVSYNWTNDLVTVTNEITNNGLLISNHSYGVPVLNDEGEAQATWLMGCYDGDAKSWDDLAYSAPYYLMVTSAGNSGADTYSGGLASGYDKLTQEKNSKNNMVVANANPFVLPNGTVNIFPINGSSSQGPSDDGRIKPDIAGDGTNLFSTYNTNTTSYATLSGTSMASPNVAGSLLLLQQYYNQLNSSFMRASTLKGLACHTARDGGTAGPDAKFGWGMLDTNKAAELIRKNSLQPRQSIISEITLNQGESFNFQVGVTSVEKLEVSISWTDPSGTIRNGIVNDPNPVLVNDLDLRVTKDTNTYFPFKLQLSNVSAAAITGDNIVDNIEKIEVSNPDGIYNLSVTHKGNLTSGQQVFSLIVSGANLQDLSVNQVKIKEITLYPNPAKNVLNYSANDNVRVDSILINDITGKSIMNFNSNLEQKTLDVSSLSSGIYFVTFNNDNSSITKKFIKQ